MSTIPWEAEATLHSTSDNQIVVAKLRDCCRMFCESPARRYADTYIICLTPVEICGQKLGAKLVGDDLIQIACAFMEENLPSHMMRRPTGPIDMIKLMAARLGRGLVRQQIRRAMHHARQQPRAAADDQRYGPNDA